MILFGEEKNMEKWDINCADCGKFILTEQKDPNTGDIKCVAGSYENGYYDGKADAFYCLECAEKRGLNNNR